jgi:hypothetical protein
MTPGTERLHLSNIDAAAAAMRAVVTTCSYDQLGRPIMPRAAMLHEPHDAPPAAESLITDGTIWGGPLTLDD